MGFLSVAVGLGVAMLGAAALVFVTGLVLFSLGPDHRRESPS